MKLLLHVKISLYKVDIREIPKIRLVKHLNKNKKFILTNSKHMSVE